MIFGIRTAVSSFRYLSLQSENSLPFTSLRSVTIGSGRDFLEGDTRRGQAQGLLECWLDPEPVVAVEVAHDDVATAEGQAIRVGVVPWEST